MPDSPDMEEPPVADHAESTRHPHEAHVREILPTSASIIEAFRQTATSERLGQQVLNTASELAVHHQRQWHAEDASRAAGASAEDIAASKRLIDGLNAHRVALVEQIDEWVAARIGNGAEASLHTETLGSVIDRLAIAWVRANSLIKTSDTGDRAHLALRQLAELADAYEDLIFEVATGHRRLPAWRPLKTYKSAS